MGCLMHVDALTRMLAAWGDSDVAAADVALAQGLAAQLDADESPGADVWREYRFALKNLREVLGGDSIVDQNIAELLTRLGGTDILDTADR